MRRVVSYGGASGVPASQRLKLKLSMTAGMHLLTSDVKEEQQGFLAPALEKQQERIIHRTSGVTRNLSSLESFKGLVNVRRDSFSSVGSSTLENAGKNAEESEGVVSGLLDRLKTKHDKALVGSSAGTDLVVDGLGPRDAGENHQNHAVKNDDHSGSSSGVGKDAYVTTCSVDLTITPARFNAADRGKGPVVSTEVSRSGASHVETITNTDNSLKEGVLGFDGAYAAQPSVCCAGERHEERCQTETSSTGEFADRQQVQGFKCELQICELASASTSSIDPGGVEGRRALHRDTDGGHLYEEGQAKDRDESAVEEPSVRYGNLWPNVIQGDLLLENSTSEDGAALRVQSWWKGWLQRKKYRVLKEEVAATTRRSQELNNAAIVLQKTWRATQSRHMLKHLKVEKTVRNRAAAVIQAHIRDHWARLKLKKLSCAALTIQKCWRRYRSSRQALAAASSVQQAEERRLHAAITLQAYARGYVVRRKLMRMHKAATTIQRQWKVYSSVRKQAAATLQAHARGFLFRRKYATYKKTLIEERAAVLIQASVRGHLVRCRLTILHTAALIIQLQWRTYSRKFQLQAAAAEGLAACGADSAMGGPAYHQADSLLQSGYEFVGVENGGLRECFDDIDLYDGEDLVGRSNKDAVEFTPDASPLEKVVVIAVDRPIDESEKEGGKGYDIAISSGREDSGLRPLLNGELPAIPTDQLPVGKASQKEDWNNVPVDHLHECLDTCLASLRSLPSDLSASAVAAEQCFPKFVILEEAQPSQQPSSSERSAGCFSLDGTEPVKVAVPANAQAITISLPTPRLQKTPSRKGVKHEIGGNVTNISSDNHLSQSTLSSGGSLQPAHGSSAKLNKDPRSKIVDHQVEETDQGGGKVQGKSRHAESLKRNEERLQQFAKVFLLQRHIAYQQQRAQSAPPFPPPALSGAGSSPESQADSTTGVCAKSPIPELDLDSVAVTEVHHSSSASQVTSVQTKHNLYRGKEYCPDTSPAIRQPVVRNQSGGVSAFKHHRQTPGPDVVVDMVLLLRKIEEVYGKSDVDFVEANNTCFPTRSGDIEEGGPVQGTRKRSSALGFTKSMSMTHIGLPNVNAVLLVIIAMVVYTKTICHSVIFGTKQTHRKS